MVPSLLPAAAVNVAVGILAGPDMSTLVAAATRLGEVLPNAVMFDINCNSGSRLGMNERAAKGQPIVRDWLLLAVQPPPSEATRARVPPHGGGYAQAQSQQLGQHGQLTVRWQVRLHEGPCEQVYDQSGSPAQQ